MALIAIMTLVVLPTTHIVYLITIASHLLPEVVILSATQLQLPLELTFPSSPTVVRRAASWLTTVDHEMSAKRLPRVAEWDVLLNHAAAEVQGVILARLTAYTVNNDVEIVVKMPGDGIGRASVLSAGWSTLRRAAPSLLRRKIWRASVLAWLLSLPLMRQSSGRRRLMVLLVVRTSHKLVLVGLDVVLEGLVTFHGDGTMTSYWSHVIANLQLYSCFADVLPKAQAFGYFPIGILTSPNRTY
jgi:hypothetical protein